MTDENVNKKDDCFVSIAEYGRLMGASHSTIKRKIKTHGWPGPIYRDGKTFVRYSLNAIRELQARLRAPAEGAHPGETREEARA